MRLSGRRFDTGEPIALEISGATLRGVAPLGPDALGGSGSVGRLPWLAPGFVDLQVNGRGGRELTDPGLTVEDVHAASRAMDADGVTAYLPTVVTQSNEVMTHALRTIAEACRQSPETARRVAGIHVEGPYLSPEDGPRGAHPLAHCRPPNWHEFARFQEAAQGRIRLITLSPEYPEAAAFIARASAAGVVVAIGHTKADTEQIRAAVEAGARLSTHLGNGAHRQLPRHPNYIWDQLAEDRLWASLIVDGHHLPPAVVKSFVRAKRPERCVLVSDLTGMADMPPGRYSTSLGDVEVLEDRRLVIAGQRQLLAGASQPIGVGVANVMRFAGVGLGEAVAMASTLPARLMGMTEPSLAAGAPANVVQFDLPGADGRGALGMLAVRATINAGEIVHGSPA
jgi:N-acetylglucosamine-6-phosphate deacetylase